MYQATFHDKSILNYRSKDTILHPPGVPERMKFIRIIMFHLLAICLVHSCIPKKKYLEIQRSIERKETNLNKLQQRQAAYTAQLILLRDSLTKTKALRP